MFIFPFPFLSILLLLGLMCPGRGKTQPGQLADVEDPAKEIREGEA